MAIRRKLLISGRVQGVFYRGSCRQEAQAAGLAGSARNLADGRVEVSLEGEPDAVERVIKWCREGPRWADVDDIEVIDEEPRGDSGFSIG